MKNNYKYAEITSFEDFRTEKERLILKSRIIETKINYNIISIRKMFSVTTLFHSLAKEFVLPKISEFFSDFIRKVENKD